VTDDHPRHEQRKCAAVTRSGGPCRMRPLRGAHYCYTHDTKAGADRARSRRLGGLHRRRITKGQVPDRVHLRTVSDARELLELAAQDALQLDLSSDRCRVLIASVGQALKVLEVGELEARLAALEARLAAAYPSPD
jgi:hypothetical protein